AVFLMGVGPLARWRAAALPELAQRLRFALVACVIGAVVALFAGGSLTSALGVLLSVWVAGATLVALADKVRNVPGGLAKRIAALPQRITRAECGMLLAHFAVGVFIFGVTMAKTWETEKDVR